MASMGVPLQFLDRSARATRGKRMSRLLDEEIEGDEQFWGQDAFKEEENDVEYEEEGEVADVFDSDFDDDEPEPDDEAVDDEDGRPVKKKKLFPGKPIIKKKIKKKGVTVPETAEGSSHRSKPSQPKHGETTVDPEGERAVRKSTRTAVIVRQAERDALRAALQASIKPVKRKKEGEERRMTQEEMLLEAAQTEIMNLRNLERMLAREEEVKKRAIIHKAVYGGPQIRFYSRDGKNILEFTKGLTFPSDIFSKSPLYPERLVCVVTGQPAKYRDPKTGLPYSTKEAFKIIRERFSEGNAHLGNGPILEMGPLYTAVSGQGFSRKGKRSTAGRVKSSSCQQKLAQLELRPGELSLSSPVARNDLIPAVSNVKHESQVNVFSDLSRSPPSLTLSQPGHTVSIMHENVAADERTCIKEKRTATPQTGASALTLRVDLSMPIPETNEAEFVWEDLDLGLRLGTGTFRSSGVHSSKEPKPTISKNVKMQDLPEQ